MADDKPVDMKATLDRARAVHATVEVANRRLLLIVIAACSVMLLFVLILSVSTLIALAQFNTRLEDHTGTGGSAPQPVVIVTPTEAP